MFGLKYGNLQRLAASEACFYMSKALASGRWWPQPLPSQNRCLYKKVFFSSKTESEKLGSFDSLGEQKRDTSSVAAKLGSGIADECGAESSTIILSRESAAPIYANPRGSGKKVYRTEVGEGGRLIANYVLFEDSMAKARVSWQAYSTMTGEERDILMAHLTAIRKRHLSYKDPKTGSVIMTVSQLLLHGKCCGIGCRHCPYYLENASLDVKKSLIWNGAFYV